MTLEELEKRVVSVETDVSREISQLKLKNYRLEIRFEAFLRFCISKDIISLDLYNGCIQEFQTFNNVLIQINSVNSIIDKVTLASEFNKTSTLKIYADDLGIKKIIEDAGGTTDFTSRMIVSKLPCSEMFKEFITQFYDTTKTPSPDAIIPAQVINSK